MGFLDSTFPSSSSSPRVRDTFQRTQTLHRRGWFDFRFVLTPTLSPSLQPFLKTLLPEDMFSLQSFVFNSRPYDPPKLDCWTKIEEKKTTQSSPNHFIINFTTTPPLFGARDPNEAPMDLEFQSGDVILQFISPTEKWNRNPSRQFQELIERLRTKHWSYWEALQETVGRRIQRYEEMLNSRTIVFLISKPTSSLKKEADKEDQDKNKGKEEVNEKVIENKKDEEGKDKEKHMIEKQKKKKEEEEHLEELRSRFETFANATPGVLYFFVDISNKEEIERMMVDVIRHQIAGKGISVKPYDHVEPEGKENDLEMKKKKEFPTLDFRETEKPAASSFRPFYSLVMTALFGKE